MGCGSSAEEKYSSSGKLYNTSFILHEAFYVYFYTDEERQNLYRDLNHHYIVLGVTHIDFGTHSPCHHQPVGCYNTTDCPSENNCCEDCGGCDMDCDCVCCWFIARE